MGERGGWGGAEARVEEVEEEGEQGEVDGRGEGGEGGEGGGDGAAAEGSGAWLVRGLDGSGRVRVRVREGGSYA